MNGFKLYEGRSRVSRALIIEGITPVQVVCEFWVIIVAHARLLRTFALAGMR
jgi:hypothetical protein